jgi:hypothetical protein
MTETAAVRLGEQPSELSARRRFSLCMTEDCMSRTRCLPELGVRKALVKPETSNRVNRLCSRPHSVSAYCGR